MANRTWRKFRGRVSRLRVQAFGRIAYVALRPKVAGVNRDVVVETWDAVADGAHNSNTDMTFWNGWFWLCHQTSPYHLGSNRSRLLLWRSRDVTWVMGMFGTTDIKTARISLPALERQALTAANQTSHRRRHSSARRP